MKWSSEPPQVAGWYWRIGKGAKYITHVSVNSRTNRASFIDHATVFYCDEVGGQWSGPIPEPEE